MPIQGAHIIHRVVLQIEVPARGMAKSIQDEVMRCWDSDILPQLQQLLDNLDNDSHILIERLELELGTLDRELLSCQLPGETLQRFGETIVDAISNNPEEETQRSLSLGSDELALEALLYFLQKGSLPWYIGSQAEWLRHEQQWLYNLLPAITAGTGKSRQLLNLLASSPQSLMRLFAQFSVEFIRQITQTILNVDAGFLRRKSLALKKMINAGFSNSEKSPLEALLNRVDIDAMALFMLLCAIDFKVTSDIQLNHILKRFTALLRQQHETGTTINRQNIMPLLADAIEEQATNTLPTKTEEPQVEAPGKGDALKDVDGLFVKQAGVIILHPFLEYFFKDFALVHEDDFADEPARQLAVHLLHYMATGKTEAFEHDLQMEKFLCGWPDEKPIERRVKLPKGMQTEADNLLRAVIKHWRALKNTSPDGLREGFLSRNGKLITNGEMPRLIVENTSLDILLASLPWGIGVVKLPWMPKILYVEWS